MDLLREAEGRNPGPWVANSINVGRAAQFIAEHVPHLDPQRVYILGLLHDIGRREGVTGMRHVIDGYRFLNGLGYPDAARIALTHSFPLQEARAVFGAWDCPPGDFDEMERALLALTYIDEDRLLQLCDSLAMAEGFWLTEKRLVDVFMRYGKNGVDPRVHAKFLAYFDLLRHFDALIGRSIYLVLPGVVETTFCL